MGAVDLARPAAAEETKMSENKAEVDELKQELARELDQLRQDIQLLIWVEECTDEDLINYAHEALLHLGIPQC
jgi:hypothetical protein